MKLRRFHAAGALVLMVGMILNSRTTCRFAAEGIDLCIRAVIPSLLPFFLLSIYMTGNMLKGASLKTVLISGFLGGYPVGAQAAAESWRSGKITKKQANLLLMFCSQAGPSFLFGIAASQFPAVIYGWALWGIQILSGITVAVLVYRPDKQNRMEVSISGMTITEAMNRALRAMASVCGWVVLFRVVLGFITFLPLGSFGNVLLSGLLELTNGCIILPQIESIPVRFVTAAVMLNFGGVCVFLQTASVIRGLNPGYYLMGKLMQTAFSALYSLAFLGYYGFLIPAALIFLRLCAGKCGKNSSIPRRVGV